MDLSEAARRLGEKFADGKLTIKCMGKDFSVDAAGNIKTDIHVNHWVTMPILCLYYGRRRSSAFRELGAPQGT